MYCMLLLFVVACHTKVRYKTAKLTCTGNKLEGKVGETVSLKAPTSLHLKLREKVKCKEHIVKSETQLKTSPSNQKI